jgi:5-(carboxyamino)imidazole ribonucleotide mutase
MSSPLDPRPAPDPVHTARAGAAPDTSQAPDARGNSPEGAPDGPVVGIVMGSDSDWPVMEAAAQALEEFEVRHEVDVVSAHRMPREMVDYGGRAAGRGLRVIIAGAGGAAHLPGMLAAVTPLPVIGVPVPLKHLDGLDALLSIVQMPAGVPVATVSVGGARNAGLLAVRILAASDPDLLARMRDFQQELNEQATEKGKRLRAKVHGAGGFGFSAGG